MSELSTQMVMVFMVKTKNREAGNTSGKGLYFQKNRAVIRIFEHMKQFGDEPVYCAVEFIEDSLLIHDSCDGPSYKLEENKSYSTPISYNSEAVKNTLVAFVDQYFKFLKDARNLKFSVFCCAKLANEKVNKEILLLAGIDVKEVKRQKEFSILKKIVNKQKLSNDELSLAKTIFIDEYKKQYEILDDDDSLKGYGGYSSQLSAWSNDEFLEFLSLIEWVFDDSDKYLDQVAIEKIKECHQFYSITDHKGKENLILDHCRGLLEKRQFNQGTMGRFVNSSDIENVFLRVGSNIQYEKPIDPAWKAFDGLEVEDARNLSDKYKAVSNVITIGALQRLSRKATNSKRTTGEEFGKEYVSLRYKIFEIGEEFIEKSKLNLEKKYSEEELEEIVEEIVDIAEKKITDWKKTYKISINDRDSLKGIVLSLFDDCFLSFDNIAQVK